MHSNRSTRLRFRICSRSGVTLAEILVAMGIAIVILATLAGVYESSSRISKRSILQDDLFAEALSAASLIENSLQQISPVPESEVWTSGEIKFSRTNGTTWSSAAISKQPGVQPQTAPTQPQNPRAEKEMIERRVTFQFAADFDGIQPLWQESVQSRPLLVHYEITASLPEGRQPRHASLAPVKLAGSIALN